MTLIKKWLNESLDCLQPIRVVATIEAKCNLACEHCYWEHDLTSPVITNWDAQAKQIAKLGVPVAYAGRLLTKPGLSFLRACQNAGVKKIGIVDNGYTIFNAPPPLLQSFDYINISIDGWREAHDRQRCKEGSFDKAWGAVLRLKALGKDPVISSAFSPLTFTDWERFEDLLAQHDVPISSTLVSAVPAAQARQVAVFIGNSGIIQAFKKLVSGIPKIINIYDIGQVRSLRDELKGLKWVPDEVDGDCLCATLESGIVVLYRPASVQWVGEIGLRWDGNFHRPTVDTTESPLDLNNLPINYFDQVKKQNEVELKVWSDILH